MFEISPQAVGWKQGTALMVNLGNTVLSSIPLGRILSDENVARMLSLPQDVLTVFYQNPK